MNNNLDERIGRILNEKRKLERDETKLETQIEALENDIKNLKKELSTLGINIGECSSVEEINSFIEKKTKELVEILDKIERELNGRDVDKV